uniref:Uncharacterized protein n=1 Tax=Anguilla anguilla TaxID=7936 RepID=A0A0E9UH08_ANGAN
MHHRFHAGYYPFCCFQCGKGLHWVYCF